LINITVESEQLEECEEFCYLRSVVTNDGRRDREIDIRLGKENAAFARLSRILVSKILSVK